MKNCIVLSDQTARRFLPGACVTALAMAFAVSLSQPAYAALKELTTHSFSANPFESNTNPALGPQGHGDGNRKRTTGGDTLTKTTFIQRLNTRGGLAPSTGCASPSDVGNQAFVPYTADYFFYQEAN